MLLKKISIALSLVIMLSACGGKADNQEEIEEYNPREAPLPKTGDEVSESAKAVQLKMLITESRRTLDSIDFAYRDIARARKQQGLSLYEKEQINQALMELNDARDLIVLETENAVITELKEKATSLQIVMEKMNTASEKMQNVAQTLSRISGVIEKTTNILAAALTSGIVRPPITPTAKS